MFLVVGLNATNHVALNIATPLLSFEGREIMGTERHPGMWNFWCCFQLATDTKIQLKFVQAPCNTQNTPGNYLQGPGKRKRKQR